MGLLARLKKGSFLLKKEIDERKPEITNGLKSNIPFDGRTGAFDGISGIQTIQNVETGVNLIEIMDLDWRIPTSWSSSSGLVWDETYQAMKITGYSNNWLKTPIIVDTNKHYQISIDVMEEVQSSTGLYLGGLDNNELGERVTPNYDYSYAANAQPATGVWTTYRVTRYGTGIITSNTSQTFNTIVGWRGDRAGLTGSLVTKYYYFGGLFNYSSGGVMYIKNPRIEIIDADTSNCVITDDGIVVEPAVINVVPNPAIFSTGWNSYTNGYTNTFITEFGTEGLNLVNKRSWCGVYRSITLPSTGTYTLSVWVKVLNRTSTSINVTLYTSGGGISDTSVTASWDANKIGKWQRISMTKTFTTTSITLLLISYGGTNAAGWEVTAQYTMPQVEAGSIANHFVDGSHGNSIISLKPELAVNPTIVFDYYYNGGVSDTVISNANYNNKWWGLYHDASGYLYTHEGAAGNSYTSTYLQTANTWAQIAIKWSNTTQYYYANGILLGSLATTGSTNTSNIPILYLGYGWNRGRAKFKNLRIYNRNLSDTEILKLAKSRNTLLPDGTIRNEIIEKPISIGEAYYFPLAVDNKILDATIGGVDEAGVAYSDRTAFTGAGAKLHFNLYSTISLNWNADFTIMYWKKPVGTNSGVGVYSGYSIESLGCNSNSVGGGYIWFGKTSGSDVLSGSSPTTITSAKYFNNWHFICLKKSGTSFTITTYGDLGSGDSVSPTKSVRSSAAPSTANLYVTQYGYDLKLGGWDNTSNCNTYFRDLIVFKRALSDLEIENIYKKEMSFFSDYVQIQHELIEEGVS